MRKKRQKFLFGRAPSGRAVRCKSSLGVLKFYIDHSFAEPVPTQEGGFPLPSLTHPTAQPVFIYIKPLF
jgi:hypothetical protein